MTLKKLTPFISFFNGKNGSIDNLNYIGFKPYCRRRIDKGEPIEIFYQFWIERLAVITCYVIESFPEERKSLLRYQFLEELREKLSISNEILGNINTSVVKRYETLKGTWEEKNEIYKKDDDYLIQFSFAEITDVTSDIPFYQKTITAFVNEDKWGSQEESIDAWSVALAAFFGGIVDVLEERDQIRLEETLKERLFETIDSLEDRTKKLMKTLEENGEVINYEG